MTVFTGSCDYELLCLDGSDSIPEGSCSLKEAGVAWLAEPGETYIIQIHHGLNSYFRGNFSLVVRPTSLPITAPGPLPLPPNDNCSGAIELSWTGDAIQGTTDCASFYHAGEFCSASIPGAPGVFYWTRATSSFRTYISLAGIPSDTSFRLFVWKGESCDQLVCVSVWGPSKDTNYFYSTRGEKYYILVKRSDRAVTGDFEISVLW